MTHGPKRRPGPPRPPAPPTAPEIETAESKRRDMFAAAALTGLIANGRGHSQQGACRLAFEFADTMLEMSGGNK